jgi:hypothetical protein
MVVTLSGCTNFEILEEKICECIAYTEVRQYNLNTRSDSGWERNGSKQFYSTECFDDGDLYGRSSTQSNGVETSTRKIVECN